MLGWQLKKMIRRLSNRLHERSDKLAELEALAQCCRTAICPLVNERRVSQIGALLPWRKVGFAILLSASAETLSHSRWISFCSSQDAALHTLREDAYRDKHFFRAWFLLRHRKILGIMRPSHRDWMLNWKGSSNVGYFGFYCQAGHNTKVSADIGDSK